MKRILTFFSTFILIFGTAAAQYSGQLSTAETVLKGNSFGSGFVAVYDDGFGVIGQYRTGVGGYSDFGGKIGIIDLDKGGSGFLLGVDYKYQIMEVRIQDPIDMSVGGMFDFAAFDNVNILSFGGFLVGSYPIEMKSGRKITPYGRLILRIDRANPDNGNSDTDFNIGLNAGGMLELSSATNAYIELQLDNQTAFFMGVNFGL